MNRPTSHHSNGKKTLANSLVALSSAAVIAVYAAGYARTAPAAGQYIATQDVPDNTVGLAPSPAPTSAPTATRPAFVPPTGRFGGDEDDQFGERGGRSRPGDDTGENARAPQIITAPNIAPTVTATAAASTGAAPAAATTGAFRDGTYTGTGTSRHGSIGVTVTVQAGKIVTAEITDCGTRYPCSRIAALPGQVLSRQSAAVDVVTGATDSTNAYRAAVNAALAQAR